MISQHINEKYEKYEYAAYGSENLPSMSRWFKKSLFTGDRKRERRAAKKAFAERAARELEISLAAANSSG